MSEWVKDKQVYRETLLLVISINTLSEKYPLSLLRCSWYHLIYILYEVLTFDLNQWCLYSQYVRPQVYATASLRFRIHNAEPYTYPTHFFYIYINIRWGCNGDKEGEEEESDDDGDVGGGGGQPAQEGLQKREITDMKTKSAKILYVQEGYPFYIVT